MAGTQKRRPTASLALLTLITLLLTLAGVPMAPPASASGDPCSPIVSIIACENSKPGNPSTEWDVSNGGDPTIQGFSTDISVNLGQTVHFKINTPAPSYHVDIYRIGYYQGNGARYMGSATVTATLPQVQPACLSDPTTQLTDCGNWGESASWSVPAGDVSGVYMAHLVRDDTGGENQIPFVVRDDARHSAMIYQTSDTTWQAYNDWGGASLYTSTAGGRAYKVSYNRPFATRADTQDGRDFFFGSEYPAVRFLEANGYDVSYQSGIDTDRSGSLLLNHSTFLSVGHDEYWSGNQRANVEAARDAGVNLAFLSGNEVFWKTRWEPSIDGTATPYRTLVTYKETKANAKIDPDPSWTGTWRDPRFSPPSDGGRPENALSGTSFIQQNANTSIQVPAADGQLRLWRNTDIATQAPGGIVTLPLGTLGYEFDQDPDNGFRPAGLFDESHTTVTSDQQLLDYGSTVGTGTATHSITTYRAPSGVLVFSVGTIQWTWGLDDHHDGVGQPPDSRMQQATVNILADMGNQPATLDPSLVAATASTDHTAPVAVITSPTPSATLTNGSVLTVTGTASDVGGVVAAVEVSVDGGATWHRATGTTSWTYTTSAVGVGAGSIKARAVDDSANLQSPPTSVAVNLICPCSIFGQTAVPATPATTDANAVELGVKFHSDIDGWITGVRFYKGTGNTGTHTGSVWSSTGQELATATFTNETAGGWQEADFAAPVAVTAGSTYVASYFAPSGHYAADSSYFALSGTPNGPLHGLANSVSTNGVFMYGAHGFPVNSFSSTNYWVDAVLSATAPPDTTPPSVTSRTPLAGASSVLTSTQPTVTFSEAVQPGTISFTLTGPGNTNIPGTVTYNGSTRTATLAPTSALPAGTPITATVTGAQDLVGNVMTTPSQWTFTTAAPTPPPGVCPCSLWNDSSVPTVITSNDARAVELGVRFTADADGSITGIRFYKGPSNTGVHTGTLWTTAGVALATATFSSESTTGWQTVTFPSPVPITAGTTYVASYHTTVGYYSATSGTFTNNKTVDNPPLHSPANVAGSPNGAYLYGNGGFPTNGIGANYWVDVVFVPGADTSPPSVVGLSPNLGATSVSVSTPVKATMSEPIQPASPTLTLTGPGSTSVSGTISYNGPTNQVIFTPAAALAPGTTYTATLSGAIDLAGNPMTAPVTWSFTTSGSTVCPCSLWSSDTTPAVAAASDPKEAELGVRFSPDADGWISGVRFYKGLTNTGTHTASLWTAAGALLATATYSGETTSGWQQVSFPAPIHVTAGQSYVASYHAPVGHYAADVNYFVNSVDNSPLHAPASVAGAPNGVYHYGTTAFPTSTSKSTNYWVDVSFSTTPPADVVPPTVTTIDPVSGQTSVAPTASVNATFSEAVDPTSVVFTLTGPSGVVGGTTTYDPVAHRSTFTPTAPLADLTTYTASMTAARDLAGNPLATPVVWSFRSAEPTAAIGMCPCLIWPDAIGPANPATTDSQAIEVGTKFRADADGWITGIRFYKGVTNTGTHTATLWSSTGTALATATFTAESAAGWQQVFFASPVAITAGITYIASYHTPTGHYAATVSGFASAGVDRGVLHALKTGIDGSNGVYAYGAGGLVPDTGIDTNYWVQPVYDVVAGAPTGAAAVPGNASATVSWVAPSDNGSAVTGYVVTPFIGAVAQTPQTFTSSALSQVVTGLANGTTYTFTVAAINGAGTGSPSAATAAVKLGLPLAPTGVTAAPGNASALVKWAAPSDNGSPITGYVVTPYIGAVAQTARTFNSTAVSQVYIGLTNGTTYTFKIAAINAIGTGAQSVATNAIMAGTPVAPTSVTATPGNASATVKWTAPAPNGSAITSYVVTPYIGAVAQAPQTFNSTTVTEVVTGLTNGTAYTFTVAAINGVGTGSPSVATTATTAGTPVAPTGPTAAPGNASATVHWVAPTDNGSPITGYVVTPFIGSTAQAPQTFNSTALTQVATGLTNGTTYTFTVAAINAMGTGSPSVATIAIIAGVPAAPAGVSAAPGNASATVAWSAPADNGSPITGYVVTPFIGSTAQAPQTFNSTALTQTVTGLTNGTTYTFRVSAINAVGTGPVSLFTTAIVVGTPVMPAGVTATPGNASATVKWSAPANNGSPITGYVVTPFIGLVAQAPQTFNSTALTEVATGLTNGTTYTFKVAAINGVGTGPQSLATTAVIAGTPLAPTGMVAAPGNASATVSWLAPANNGSPITGYVVTPFIGLVAQAPQTFNSTALTEVATGLTNGTTYTFKVAAINAMGTGPQSLATNAIMAGTPGTPTAVTVMPANASATVHWTAPANNGSPITGYVVTPFIGAVAQAPQTFNSTALSEVATGLTNGTTYTFKVAAINAIGTGPQSLATTAIMAGTPVAPTGVGATAGVASATVNWLAPANNGSPITGYVVTPYINGVAQAPQTFNSTALSEVVTGLTSGTLYTFKVAAINGVGTGPQSVFTAGVTPT